DLTNFKTPLHLYLRMFCFRVGFYCSSLSCQIFLPSTKVITGQPLRAIPSHGQHLALLYHSLQTTILVLSMSMTVMSAKAPSSILPMECHFSGRSDAGELVIFLSISSIGTSG